MSVQARGLSPRDCPSKMMIMENKDCTNDSALRKRERPSNLETIDEGHEPRQKCARQMSPQDQYNDTNDYDERMTRQYGAHADQQANGIDDAHVIISMLYLVLTKLDGLERSVRDLKAMVTNEQIVEEEDIIPGLKISKMEDMESFQKELIGNEGKQNKLIKALANLTSRDDLGHVCRSIMRALMTNGFMSLYSVKGQKGKAAFKDTFIFQLVIKAMKLASNGKASQTDIISEIGEVLRNAPHQPGGSKFKTKIKL
ncbi:uncharacterized protein [Amphiura filiformis]|uniref:uncharacterized protein n=1 Tax=Amphiura filiformis TaxID=82378 RepID=UPI003B21A7C6